MFNICCPTLGILEKIASNIANVPYPTRIGNILNKRTFFTPLHSSQNMLFLTYSITHTLLKKPDKFCKKIIPYMK